MVDLVDVAGGKSEGEEDSEVGGSGLDTESRTGTGPHLLAPVAATASGPVLGSRLVAAG